MPGRERRVTRTARCRIRAGMAARSGESEKQRQSRGLVAEIGRSMLRPYNTGISNRRNQGLLSEEVEDAAVERDVAVRGRVT